ncbi:aryl-alcohol dehydrogenase-like predicted oxidoreductase [Breoghania corrubedonensis]|uniref:Aryl-alcohol dehydrogenase-like predicted oxidoreductase n=2 Tax=Breoghania corrubedonensis TaxID=665038 RepID=A0A2T5VH92_9HYPH|nr:aryl-alcohol dehydrogenase-like predicted oxidoreductase [Breoghania corrubedonensis]
MTTLPTTGLPTTKLGQQGPTVGLQGLGCMAMATDYYGPTDSAQALATLDRALERGVTLFDTADIYGEGRNEQFIAPFIRANRDHVTIATKFGINRFGPAIDQVRIENSPEYIRQAVDGSLRRLGIEVIDLYYMHRRNPAVPLAESVGAMADLVKQGKARFLGLSEVSADELREAHAVHPIAALQTEWSLFSRHVEDSIVPTAAELGVGFVPYSPLGRGQLTGRVDPGSFDEKDVRKLYDRFVEDDNARLIDAIKAIAARYDATAAQIALAWLHSRSKVFGLAVVPIPGTRKPSRLDENVGGAQLLLSDADLTELGSLADRVKGSRDMGRPSDRS